MTGRAADRRCGAGCVSARPHSARRRPPRVRARRCAAMEPVSSASSRAAARAAGRWCAARSLALPSDGLGPFRACPRASGPLLDASDLRQRPSFRPCRQPLHQARSTCCASGTPTTSLERRIASRSRFCRSACVRQFCNVRFRRIHFPESEHSSAPTRAGLCKFCRFETCSLFARRDMLHLFRRDPDRVSWQLTTDSGFYRLVVRHADGVIVERYGSPEQALRRVHQLEDQLESAHQQDHQSKEGQ